MIIEMGDKLRFSDLKEDLEVIEHGILTTDEFKNIKEVFKETEGIEKVVGFILLKEEKK